MTGSGNRNRKREQKTRLRNGVYWTREFWKWTGIEGKIEKESGNRTVMGLVKGKREQYQGKGMDTE